MATFSSFLGNIFSAGLLRIFFAITGFGRTSCLGLGGACITGGGFKGFSCLGSAATISWELIPDMREKSITSGLGCKSSVGIIYRQMPSMDACMKNERLKPQTSLFMDFPPSANLPF